MRQKDLRAYAIIMQHIGFLKGVSAHGGDVSAEEVSNTAYAIEEQVEKLFKVVLEETCDTEEGTPHD